MLADRLSNLLNTIQSVYSSSVYFSPLSGLLHLSSLSPFSSLGLADLTDKKVIVADYILPFWTASVPAPIFHRIFVALASRQVQIASLLRRYDAPLEQVLFDAYVEALHSDPNTGLKVVSIGGNPQQIEAWLGPTQLAH